MWKFLFIGFVLLLASYGNIYSQTANDYLEQADGKYAAGDTEGAVKDLEKAIDLAESEDDKEFYKFMLGTWLIPLAEKYYNEGNYEKALPYLKRLAEISPDDEEIMKMYGEAKRLTEKEEEVVEEKVEKVEKVVEEKVIKVEEKKEVKEEVKKEVKVEVRKEVELGALISLMESYMEKQEKILRNQREKLTEELLRRSEAERNVLLTEFEKREKLSKTIFARAESEIKALQTEFKKKGKELRQSYVTIIIGALGIFFVVIFIFMISSGHYTSRRERAFRREVIKIKEDGIVQASYAKIIDKIERKLPQLRLAGRGDRKYDQREFDKLAVSGDVESRIRVLKAVESEMSDEFSLSKEFGIRLISPFLNDSEPEVKAHAIDILYGCLPHEATRLLNGMLKDVNPKVRIEAVNVLRNWFPPKSVKILLELKGIERDLEVKRAIIHLLSDFMRNKKRFLPHELQSKIGTVIIDIQREEKWIVE